MRRTLLRLPPHVWLTALEVLTVSLGVIIGLRRRAMNRLLRLARQPRLASRRASPEQQNRLAELTWVSDAVFRRWPGGLTCLERSLILLLLLRRRRIGAEVKIGLTKHRDTLQAHAWLEQDGRSIDHDEQAGRQFQGVISLAPHSP